MYLRRGLVKQRIFTGASDTHKCQDRTCRKSASALLPVSSKPSVLKCSVTCVRGPWYMMRPLASSSTSSNRSYTCTRTSRLTLLCDTLKVDLGWRSWLSCYCDKETRCATSLWHGLAPGGGSTRAQRGYRIYSAHTGQDRGRERIRGSCCASAAATAAQTEMQRLGDSATEQISATGQRACGSGCRSATTMVASTARARLRRLCAIVNVLALSSPAHADSGCRQLRKTRNTRRLCTCGCARAEACNASERLQRGSADRGGVYSTLWGVSCKLLGPIA